MKIKFFLLLITVLFAELSFGQLNLQKFDRRKYHFGFLISGNSSSFYFTLNQENMKKDSILGVANLPQGGFDLNLLASLDVTPNFHVRFVPGLSFQDRGLEYRTQEFDQIVTVTKRTESVYLQFPLLMKFRTNRVKNFAAFGVLGGSFELDMQSQKNVTSSGPGGPILKLERNNYAIISGAGFDFFLPFFKFGIELKAAVGLPDILIQDPENVHSESLNSLKTRSFSVSITFEG